MAWQDEVNKQVDNMKNTRDFSANYDQEDIEKNKVVCGLSYVGILFWLPLAVCPNSKFGRFHTNQALLAFICYCVVNIVRAIVSVTINLTFGNFLVADVVSPLGTLLNTIIGVVLTVICLGIMLFGMINTLSGKAKELPVIGKIRLIK